MLECIEIETGKHPSTAIIWMHGLGASSHDFEDLPHMLSLPQHIHYRFILPQAPQLAVTINHGYVMPAWYNIEGMDFRTQEDQQGMHTSAQAIRSLMQREVKRGIKHIILGGFSQGGAIALYTGIRENSLPIAAMVSLSAYLPRATKLEQSATILKRPIFMAHGTNDPVVPIAWGKQSYHQLQHHHYPVSWHDYPMQHQICDAEISALSRYLSDIVNSLTSSDAS